MSQELKLTFVAVVLLTFADLVHGQHEIDIRRWLAHARPAVTHVAR